MYSFALQFTVLKYVCLFGGNSLHKLFTRVQLHMQRWIVFKNVLYIEYTCLV